MALNISVKVLGTLVEILAQKHLGNYNFSLLSATSLCDHPQNLSVLPGFLLRRQVWKKKLSEEQYSKIATINSLAKRQLSGIYTIIKICSSLWRINVKCIFKAIQQQLP